MESKIAKEKKSLRPLWKPGESGNPEGRPKGVKSWDQRIREELRADFPALLAKLRDKALGGDRRALQYLIDRVLPAPRTTAPMIELAALHSAATLTDKANAVLDAVAAGELAPDLGAALIEAISKVVAVTEIDEMQRRIAALENRAQKEGFE